LHLHVLDPDEITRLVKDYITKEFAKLNSKNKINVECIHAGKWWLSDPNHWNYVAGSRAIETVFKTKPDFTREGGSIPVTLTFQEALGRIVLLLPMGACDDGAHSINEKIDRRNCTFILDSSTNSVYRYRGNQVVGVLHA
jgi:Cys-Gly metallodipeptidase DUG1